MKRLPHIYSYLDYRLFLKDLYNYRKAKQKSFSYRWLAKKAQFRSPSYLKMIIDGTRNMKPETAVRLAIACQLNEEQTRYFTALVGFNQATSHRTRQVYYDQLRSFRGYQKAHLLDQAYASYHAHWYIPVVYALIAHKDFRNDTVWIAKKLVPPITTRQAGQALSTLRTLGLVVEENGQLKQANKVLTTGAETQGLHIVNFHRAMMQRASESIDLIDAAERDISALTLSLRDEDIAHFKDRLAAFRRELLQIATSVREPTRIVQLNLQLFPLSAPTRKRRS